MFGGERGIRTLDTGLPYTHFPGVRLQPLGHLSVFSMYLFFLFTQVPARALRAGERDGFRKQSLVFFTPSGRLRRPTFLRKAVEPSIRGYPTRCNGTLSRRAPSTTRPPLRSFRSGIAATVRSGRTSLPYLVDLMKRLTGDITYLVQVNTICSVTRFNARIKASSKVSARL